MYSGQHKDKLTLDRIMLMFYSVMDCTAQQSSVIASERQSSSTSYAVELAQWY